MPRPPDNYTHGQFVAVDVDGQSDTVRCIHCKEWTGGAKTLNRKKEHLQKCAAYQEWRAAGNGEELQPAHPYNKRVRGMAGRFDDSDNDNMYALQYTPLGPQRNRYPDLSKFFREFFDEVNGQKCMRTRCNFCGYVRAKNTTRQFEHLQSCQEFLQSTEGQQALANGELALVVIRAEGDDDGPGTINNSVNSEIWKGALPNPNLAGRPMARATKPANKNGRSSNLTPFKLPQAPKLPSIINLLLSNSSAAVTTATQQQFLSHAGCGTLSASALNQWLAQEIHISRALIPFVGSLIGKIRIPESDKLQYDPTFRATDLLCSAVNNMKKELEFIEATKRRYLLQVPGEEPKPATKGIIDLFNSAASAPASLLEGLVVLWSIEHLFCVSFQYAGNFVSSVGKSSSYSLPSYLTPSRSNGRISGSGFAASDNAHISALHESFIPNWTSVNYIRFVEACKAIVDEIANAQTSGNGAQEMMACERAFKQTVWLWSQIWPEVTGMGEEDELASGQKESLPKDGNSVSAAKSALTSSADTAVNLVAEDEDESDGDMNSPFADSGLSAIVAASGAD